MKSRRAISRWILAAIAVITLVALFLQRPQSLVDQANKVPLSESIGPSGRFYRPYRWLNDHEVLFERFDGNSYHLMRLRTDEPSSAAVPVAVHIDSTDYCQVSPNGRSLCWVQSALKHGRHVDVITTATVTGSSVVNERPVYELQDSDFGRGNFIWSGDSRSVLWTLRNYNNGPAIRQLFVDTGHVHTWYLPWKDPNGEGDFSNLKLSRGLADDRLIVSNDLGSQWLALIAPGRHPLTREQGYYFANFKLSDPLDHPTEWIAPNDWYQDGSGLHSNTLSVSVSPQADRLLWTTVYDVHRPWEAVLARLHLGPPTQPRYLIRYLVSDLRGEGKHEFASGEIAVAEAYATEPQWTPDGKKISFFYRGGLYLIPVK